MSKCPVCDKEKKEKNKYCSFQCRNIIINKNKDYKTQGKNVSKGLKERSEKLRIEKLVNCDRCNKELTIKSNTKGEFKDKYFCSRSCSNTHSFTKERNIKISIKIKEYISKHGGLGAVTVKEKHECLNCDNLVVLRKKFCCKKCMTIYNRKNMTEYQKYKNDTKFKFSLNNYPDEFDFSLIEKYGWYSPTNKNNNLEGVSRDHILSVKEGFELGIDPSLIAHPANCRLLKHTDNISKNKKSIITYNELLQRINIFESKYGKYLN